MTDANPDDFFSKGYQYYVTGRYATHAGFAPIAGNVLHHAIENLLKGGLAKTKSLARLRKLGHDLPKIWRTFKKQVNDPALTQFDGVILTLNEFEDVRYVDPKNPHGMEVSFYLTKASRDDVRKSPLPPSVPPSSVPEYELCLEEIDELAGAIFVAASLDAKVWSQTLHKSEAKEFLVRNNAIKAITGA